jgi:hypothetical protein
MAFRKGPPVRIVNLVVDPYQGIAALATAMVIPGYVFTGMERRGIRAKLKFLREDLAGAA